MKKFIKHFFVDMDELEAIVWLAAFLAAFTVLSFIVANMIN